MFSRLLPYGLKRKNGQVVGVILMAVAVMVFVSVLGIYHAKRQLIKTKAIIASEAGAMYLTSLVGSYAYYLSCTYTGCECKESRSSFGLFVNWLVSILLSLLSLGSGAPVAAALIAIAATLKTTFDYLMLLKRVKQLNKQFKKMSLKDSIRWQVIQYVVFRAITDEFSNDLLNKVLDMLEERVNEVVYSGDSEEALDETLKGKLKELLSEVFSIGAGEVSPDFKDVLFLWNDLTQDSLVSACSEHGPICIPEDLDGDGVIGDDECRWQDQEVSCLTISTDILWGGRGQIGLYDMWKGLEEDMYSGLGVLDMIYDWGCRLGIEEEGCSEEIGDLYEELDDVVSFMGDVADIVEGSDVQEVLFVDDETQVEVRYSGGGAEEILGCLEEMSEQIGIDGDVAMLEDEYKALKNDITAIAAQIADNVSRFQTELDSEMNGLKDRFKNLFGDDENGSGSVTPISAGKCSGDFAVAWRDKLGASHCVGVSVHFPLPRPKAKMGFFKKKIKIKHCDGTVWVEVYRDGIRVKTCGHYYGKKGHGPKTSSWWIKSCD